MSEKGINSRYILVRRTLLFGKSNKKSKKYMWFYMKGLVSIKKNDQTADNIILNHIMSWLFMYIFILCCIVINYINWDMDKY